mgnify:CR=1 FL=1
MKKKLLIATGVLILWLFIANSVCGMFVKGNDIAPKRIQMQDYESATISEVFFSLGETESIQDLSETFQLSGWSFCETTQPNDTKTITAIWKRSDGLAYGVEIAGQQRPDIRAAFPDKEIVGDMHGFTTKISTISMKNGVYELLLYDKENDAAQGLVSTGLFFKKEGRMFTAYGV